MIDSCPACGDAPSVVTGLSVHTGCGAGVVCHLESDEPDGPYVLVAPMTDNSCLDRFAGAAAVVTDQGTEMCHAAILAREFLIPCVVGAFEATVKLRSGEKVLVCGTRGAILRPEE